ncbi:group III truncated hemoglobin [Pseudovibrio sp. Tun.PSC04-5.I4]|uniref:group III truncated hemoglobin n=1 Tax=Pseudovibrio sp. Tun.PSC04-5.I4 TaxID=1798213 RepID=UPI0008900C74|nr:group III truncated hemoglobin [Pseudovibrio sp. Tun.PSC04-5.I4]SDQ78370.1 hemoglobin [Pseudovibrio sp. Tun.PSC04-5.I4]
MTYQHFDIRPLSECTPVHPELTHTQVRALVTSHVDKLRKNKRLAGVYLSNLRCDWEDYEAQAMRFWCSALLKDQSYSGRPLGKYRSAAAQVCSDDIASWLNLFENAVEECIADAAQADTKKSAAQVVDCFHMAMNITGADGTRHA